jgi:hypothetical protein
LKSICSRAVCPVGNDIDFDCEHIFQVSL